LSFLGRKWLTLRLTGGGFRGARRRRRGSRLRRPLTRRGGGCLQIMAKARAAESGPMREFGRLGWANRRPVVIDTLTALRHMDLPSSKVNGRHLAHPRGHPYLSEPKNPWRGALCVGAGTFSKGAEEATVLFRRSGRLPRQRSLGREARVWTRSRGLIKQARVWTRSRGLIKQSEQPNLLAGPHHVGHGGGLLGGAWET
jgi:hypothetical protein